MSADYYFFAPTGGRYQTVFRGTLPRRCSIRRSRWDNALTSKNDYFHLPLSPFAQCSATKKHHTLSEAFATSRLHGAIVTYRYNL